MLGYEQMGSGKMGVVVLHDWMCDSSSWRTVRQYLNKDEFAWIFVDLRGYGMSLSQRGDYTVEEAAADVLALTETFDMQRLVVIGHSMSSLVALHLAQTSNRFERAVLVCPNPPRGLGVDETLLSRLIAVAKGDDTLRMQAIMYTLGDRLSEGWARYKVARWRATSDSNAVAGYVHLFAVNGVPNPEATAAIPILAVTGEQDAPSMRGGSVKDYFAPICPQLTIASIAECGHYPMQETPPLLATIIERFLHSV